jgi:hypothetical protein
VELKLHRVLIPVKVEAAVGKVLELAKQGP